MKSLTINYLPREFNSIIWLNLIASGKVGDINLSAHLISPEIPSNLVSFWYLLIYRTFPSELKSCHMTQVFPQCLCTKMITWVSSYCKISIDYQDYKGERWKLNILKWRFSPWWVCLKDGELDVRGLLSFLNWRAYMGEILINIVTLGHYKTPKYYVWVCVYFNFLFYNFCNCNLFYNEFY